MESKNSPLLYIEKLVLDITKFKTISHNYTFLKYSDFQVCIAFQEESRDSHRSVCRLGVIL